MHRLVRQIGTSLRARHDLEPARAGERVRGTDTGREGDVVVAASFRRHCDRPRLSAGPRGSGRRRRRWRCRRRVRFGRARHSREFPQAVGRIAVRFGSYQPEFLVRCKQCSRSTGGRSSPTMLRWANRCRPPPAGTVQRDPRFRPPFRARDGPVVKLPSACGKLQHHYPKPVPATEAIKSVGRAGRQCSAPQASLSEHTSELDPTSRTCFDVSTSLSTSRRLFRQARGKRDSSAKGFVSGAARRSRPLR